jgi:hypothetical protein
MKKIEGIVGVIFSGLMYYCATAEYYPGVAFFAMMLILVSIPTIYRCYRYYKREKGK